MKIRIKETGEVKTVCDYSRIQVEDCDSHGNPQEYKLDEIKIIQDESVKERDWEEIRIKAAIAAMQGFLSNYKLMEDVSKVSEMTNKRDETIITASCCIEFANELVEQLKKKEYESK